jgi:hypothetical protein
MTSTFSPPITGNDDNIQQPRSTDIPTNFVLGRPHTGPARANNNQQFINGSSSYIQISDVEHNLSLFDHLATDLGNLLNRTDISDCFLNVQGRINFFFRKIFIESFCRYIYGRS